MGPERVATHRCDRFVKCRKNARVGDDRCDVVPVHVGSQIWIDAREGDLDRAAAVTRSAPGLRGGVYTELGDRRLGGHGLLATPQ